MPGTTSTRSITIRDYSIRVVVEHADSTGGAIQWQLTNGPAFAYRFYYNWEGALEEENFVFAWCTSTGGCWVTDDGFHGHSEAIPKGGERAVFQILIDGGDVIVKVDDTVLIDGNLPVYSPELQFRVGLLTHAPGMYDRVTITGTEIQNAPTSR